MQVTYTSDEEREEDIAIAKAIANASFWVKNAVSPIDAISCFTNTTPTERNKNDRSTVSQNYICHRCKLPGHHISKCVTNGDRAFDKPIPKRVAAGIPQSFMTSITAEEAEKDSNAVLRHDGTYASLIPRKEVFSAYTNAVKQAERSRIPSRLACGLCKNLIKNPIQFPCCPLSSFCSDCIIQEDESLGNTVYCVICNRDCLQRKLIRDTLLEKDINTYKQEQLNKKRQAPQQLTHGRADKFVRHQNVCVHS